MMRWEQSFVGLVLGVSLLTLGCGGGPKVVVTGEVTLDGQPLDGANVVLEPEDIKNNIGAAATNKDGKFEISPYGIRNVLAAGEYVATINKHVFREDKNPKLKNMDPEIKKELLKMAKLGELPVGRGKEREAPLVTNAVPAVYQDKKTSPLKFTLKSGVNNLPPFQLKSR